MSRRLQMLAGLAKYGLALALTAWLQPSPVAAQRAQSNATAGQCFSAVDAAGILAGCTSLLAAPAGYSADQVGLALLRRAIALDELQRTDEAIADLELLLRRNTRADQANTLIGNIRLGQKRTQEAERNFRAALRGNADYPEAHYGLGRALYAQGNLDGAIQSFDASLRLRPGYLDALFQRAQAHQDKGDSNAALKDMDLAVTSSNGDDHILALVYRGRFRNNAKRYDDAIADCSEANRLASRQPNQLQPLKAAAHICLGLARTSQGDLGAAKSSYDEALSLSPRDTAGLTGRGYISYQRGKYAEAANDFEAALAIQPSNQDALRYAGLAYADQGDTAKAMEAFRKAIAAAPQDPWPMMLRAITLARTGDRERALRDANAAFGFASVNRSDALLARGSVYYMLEDLDAAERDIRAAIADNAESGQAHLALARLLVRRGQIEAAARSIDAAARTIPHDPSLPLNRGLVALARKDFAAAVRDVSASLAVNDAHAEGFSIRGQAYEGQGQRDRAIADYRTSVGKLALDNDGRRAQRLAGERLAALTSTAGQGTGSAASAKGASQVASRAGSEQPAGTSRPGVAPSRDSDIYDTAFCRMFESVFSHPRRYTGVDFDAGCRIVPGQTIRPPQRP